MKTFTNARVFTGEHWLENATVAVAQHQIQTVAENRPLETGTTVVDLQGLCMAPALIDLQIYGGKGHLFNNEPTPECLQKTYEAVLEGGGAHFQITLSSVPYSLIWEGIAACKAYWAAGGKGLLGLHLEGPYFNPEKRGAHPLKNIRQPTREEVSTLIERGREVVTYITVAPEQFDDETLDLLLQSGIYVSAGHSNATFAQAMHGFQQGIGRATHLFNAMSPFQSRAPGMVGAVYTAKPWASIIADGVHCDFAALRISKALLGEKLFLITDAVTPSTSGDYRFRFAGDRYLDESGTLAGSSLTMWQAVKNVVNYADIDLDEALRMASTYPAQAAGQGHRLGRIAPAFEADFILFDKNLNLKGVVIQGVEHFFV